MWSLSTENEKGNEAKWSRIIYGMKVNAFIVWQRNKMYSKLSQYMLINRTNNLMPIHSDSILQKQHTYSYSDFGLYLLQSRTQLQKYCCSQEIKTTMSNKWETSWISQGHKNKTTLNITQVTVSASSKMEFDLHCFTTGSGGTMKAKQVNKCACKYSKNHNHKTYFEFMNRCTRHPRTYTLKSKLKPVIHSHTFAIHYHL